MSDTIGGQARLSPWWRHATILVMIAGFSLLSLVTVLTYTNAPPIPGRVTDASGATLVDRQAILRGQEVFLKYGLMEHGTLWGHGAYLGPDYTAEYLHRLAEICGDGEAASSRSSRTATTRRATRSPSRRARRRRCGHSRASGESTSAGKRRRRDCRPGTSGTRPSSRTSSPTSPGRPGRRSPTAPARTTRTRTTGPTSRWSATGPRSSTYLWSALSLITLLGGIGTILFCFGKFDYLGWGGDGTPAHYHDAAISGWKLTPSQWGDGEVLRRRGGALPAAGAGRRRARALSRRARVLLRDRHRVVTALQPAPHLAPPARDLLDRHRLGGGRAVPGPARGTSRAEGAAPGRERPVRRAGRGRARKPARRSARDQRPARRAVVLARPPGLGVPGPRAALAAAARGGARALARAHVPGAAAGDEGGRALRARVALPLLRRGDPDLLPAGALLRPPHQLRRDRQLALLDHPPLGRRLLRAVRDGAGGARCSTRWGSSA